MYQNRNNNWAVLVCSSDFWFNYRHASSVLGVYEQLLRLGFLRSNIVLFNSLDAVCSPKNPNAGCMPSNSTSQASNAHVLIKPEIIADFKGREVTVQNFLNLLTGRSSSSSPASKRLSSHSNSNILIYLSGHGGDEFFKFNDQEELNTDDLVHAFREMELKQRYREVLFMVDTCQAETLGSRITSNNVTFIASSRKGENSYGYQWSDRLSAGLNDRFSHQVIDFFTRPRSTYSLDSLLAHLDPAFLHSHVFVSSTAPYADIGSLQLLDFFSSSPNVQRASVNNFTDRHPLYTSTAPWQLGSLVSNTAGHTQGPESTFAKGWSNVAYKLCDIFEYLPLFLVLAYFYTRRPTSK
jgi:phosphatidylinositol glycan class K